MARLGLLHAAGLGVLLELGALGVLLGKLAQAGLALGAVLRLLLGALDGLPGRAGLLFGHPLGEAAVLVGQLDRIGLGVEGTGAADRLDPQGARLVDAAIDQKTLVAGDLLVGEAQGRRVADRRGLGVQRCRAGQLGLRVDSGGIGRPQRAAGQREDQGGEAGERKETASAHGTAGLAGMEPLTIPDFLPAFLPP